MERPDYIPQDYDGIKVVGSLRTLFNEPFGEANAILCPRRLSDDFNALAWALKGEYALSDNGYLAMSHDDLEMAARYMPKKFRPMLRQIIKDSARMAKEGGGPILRVLCGSGYIREGDEDSIIYKFHFDGLATGRGRICCAYNAPVTEFIRNEDVFVTEEDGEAIVIKKDGAPVFSFRPGDMWRHSGIRDLSTGFKREAFYEQNPFVHRGVPVKTNAPPRLLLIG